MCIGTPIATAPGRAGLIMRVAGREANREHQRMQKAGTKKATLRWLYLEARAGVEPTYTDLQSGA